MPEDIKPVKTIDKQFETSLKEKGSVFKGVIYPIKTEDEVGTILNMVRKTYYDATHHCYACRLMNEHFKYSDDGEPSGTAGKRILNAIDHYELKDVLCIVVRWFGGVKLGTGLLGKAYYSSAEEVIKSAEIITKKPYSHFIVKAGYETSRQLYHLFQKYGIKIEKKDYSDIPEYHCLFPFENIDNIIQEFSNYHNVKIKDSHKIFYILDTAID
jgi:uncharacterized YigZ family protein